VKLRARGQRVVDAVIGEGHVARFTDVLDRHVDLFHSDKAWHVQDCALQVGIYDAADELPASDATFLAQSAKVHHPSAVHIAWAGLIERYGK
jgi:hypothetical protein